MGRGIKGEVSWGEESPSGGCDAPSQRVDAAPRRGAGWRDGGVASTSLRRGAAATTFAACLAFACFLTLPAAAAPDARPQTPDPIITERGPHHRVWSKQVVTPLGNGRSRTNSSSFVELGSGMHRWDAQTARWIDAEAVIEIEGNTAVARKTAHGATFGQNANSPGVITLITPDGKRLRSHCIGLAFFESATSRSEMFASIKDSPGELHPPNVVVYPDAFDGDPGFRADLRYTVRLGSFEQDVVILTQPPPLPDGFAADTTRIEVWTEFIEAPESIVTQRARAAMVDDTVSFGEFRTGAGRAFALGEETNPRRSAPVAKRWLTTEGRTFLVESVRYNTVKRELDKLPEPNQQAALKPQNANAQLAAIAPPSPPSGERAGVRGQAAAPHFGDRAFPPAPKPRANASAEKFRTASSPSPLGGERVGVRGVNASEKTALLSRRRSPTEAEPRRGFVIDYTVISSISDLTLKCDTTYYVTNTAWLGGAVSIEGGTVVKFAKTNIAQIVFDEATVRWLTDQYRPAIFTAVDDHTVGEVIGAGTLSGHYGSGLRFTSDPSETNQNFRTSHLGAGISTDLTVLGVRHAQFVHCGTALSAGAYNTHGITIENSLFYDVDTVFDGEVGFSAYQVTVHQCDSVANASYEHRYAHFYNSLVLDEPNFGESVPVYNNSYSGSSAGILQTVGAAAHYLANGSVHRNAGATNGLSATLIADLKKRTTYPPIVLSNVWQTNWLVLSPQAQRDTDTLDRGYHYDPLDYVCGFVAVENATLQIQPGTAIGAFSPAVGGDFGLSTRLGATLVCEGTPTNLNRLVRYNTVQEQANTNWSGLRGPIFRTDYAGETPSTSRFRFTEWAVPAADASHIYSYYQTTDLGLSDSQFHGGKIDFLSPSLKITNCLLNRSLFSVSDDGGVFEVNLKVHHNTFHAGALNLTRDSSDTWTFRNNLFALTAMTNTGTFDATNNGYVTNAVCQPLSATDTNRRTSSLTFETGALGRFYIPSTSIFTNSGSTTADLLGLYHFTTTTNQVKETNSIVDIGFHYVAVGANGLPVDTDGDGIPDYVEDANGNGALDHRETKPNDATDAGLRVFITRPRSGSNIP